MNEILTKRKVRITLLGLTGLGALLLLYHLQWVFNPFLLALALAYIMNPIIRFMEQRKIPRKWAIGIVFFSGIVALALSMVILVPALINEARMWHQEVVGEPFDDTNGNGWFDPPRESEPYTDENKNDEYDGPEKFTDTNNNGTYDPGVDSYVDKNKNGKWDPGEKFEDLNKNGKWDTSSLVDQWNPSTQDLNHNGKFDEGYLQRINRLFRERGKEGNPLRELLLKFIPEEKLDSTIQKGLNAVKSNLKRIASSSGKILSRAWSEAWVGVAKLWNLILLLLLTPIYLAFLLNGLDHVWNTFTRYIPGKIRPGLMDILYKIDLVLSSFFRGRLLICTSIGVFTAAGFWFCDVKFGLLFGLLIGLLSFIPFLNIFGLIPALFTCWMDDFTLYQYAAVLIVFGIGQALDPLLTSLVMGKSLALHPVTILLSLFACSALFGFFGMMLAVPIVATAKILATEWLLPTLKSLADEEPDQQRAADP